MISMIICMFNSHYLLMLVVNIFRPSHFKDMMLNGGVRNMECKLNIMNV